jgi:hypothetical protein
VHRGVGSRRDAERRALDDLALDVVGEAIARTSVDDFIAVYERSRGIGSTT